MQALRRLAAGVSVVAALGIVPGAVAQTAKPAQHPVAPHAASTHGSARDDASHPHVYLMRGLLNIFSLGMDQLAAQIARNGVDASVYNHSVEETIVDAIAQKYRAGDHGPYILVGHSLGADAVMLMALQLNAQGVPVALVVPFDGTASYAAPANVSCVVNVTQRKYAYMQAGPGFHGRLSNVDVSSDTTIDHVTIDKSPRLQAMALKEILQAAHGQSCRPGTNAPSVARAKQSGPNAIVPADIGSKESATKGSAPTAILPANNPAPAKSVTPAKSVPPAKNASTANRAKNIVPIPANSAVPAKSTVPGAPAKSAAPANGASPEKSAAAPARAS
jgi:pimeloyl-ACP methyl ester carboxylesterase